MLTYFLMTQVTSYVHFETGSSCRLIIWIPLLMSMAGGTTQNSLPVAMNDNDPWVRNIVRMALADRPSMELAQKRIMAYQAMLDDNLEKMVSARPTPSPKC
jgi:hypothetical protein